MKARRVSGKYVNCFCSWLQVTELKGQLGQVARSSSATSNNILLRSAMMSPSSAPSQYDEKHRSVLKKIEKDRKEAQEVRSQYCERFKAARCHRCTVDLANIASSLPYAPWNLTLAKRLIIYDKCTAYFPTNIPTQNIITR